MQTPAASRSSSTIQLRPASGIHIIVAALAGVLDEGGRKAFRVHPMHVRTIAVDNTNEVIEQRAVFMINPEKEVVINKNPFDAIL